MTGCALFAHALWQSIEVLLLFNETSQVGPLEPEQPGGFRLIPFRQFKRAADKVTAVLFHRLMVGQMKIGERVIDGGAQAGFFRQEGQHVGLDDIVRIQHDCPCDHIV